MKKLIVLVSMLMLSTSVLAWNNSNDNQYQGPGQPPGQSKFSDNDNRNSNSNRNSSNSSAGAISGSHAGAVAVTGDSKAYGGSSYAKGGKASSGGNSISTSTVVEGDDVSASSAIAGPASSCVSVIAAQAEGGGFSIGGIDGDCRAAMAAERNFKLYDKFKASHPDKANEFLEAGFKYSELANPSVAKIYANGARNTVMDTVLSFGWLALIAL